MDATPARRRLAAIVAADIAGYSRLMGTDEDGTLARLKRCFGEVVGPAVAAAHGQIVKTTGDGFLALFDSVTDALRAALAIQAGQARADAGVPPDRAMRLRIAINLGEVVADGGDVFGDGVNVAARVQALAEPGGVLLTQAAREQVRGQVAAVFAPRGEHRLKNIAAPVRVWEARAGAAPAAARPWPRWRAAAGLATIALALAAAVPGWIGIVPPAGPADGARPHDQSDPRPALAVLPFSNLGDDPQQDYFNDGLAEDILTALTRFRGLRVMARNSSFRFRGADVDLAEVRRALNVTFVLAGSARRADGQVRITVRLIDARSGEQRWAERYDRPLRDVLAMQDEIASSVVASLAPQVASAEPVAAATGIAPPPPAAFAPPLAAAEPDDTRGRGALRLRTGEPASQAGARPPPPAGAGRPGVDPDAYDLALRARSAAPAEALGLLERALARDAGYAAAWSALSATLLDASDAAGAVPMDARDRAVQAARRAAALAPADGLAQARLARALAVQSEYDAALAAAARADELAPGDPAALLARADALGLAGRHRESLAALARAAALDPVGTAAADLAAARAHFLLGELPQAQAALERCTRRDAVAPACWRDLAATLARAGRAAEASAAAARHGALAPGFRVAAWRRAAPLREAADKDALAAAYRLAGLPE